MNYSSTVLSLRSGCQGVAAAVDTENVKNSEKISVMDKTIFFINASLKKYVCYRFD